MYSLELHPSIYDSADLGYPHPKFKGLSQAQIDVVRIEVCRIRGVPVFAYGLAPLYYPDFIFESLLVRDAKSMAILVHDSVLIVKKNGAILLEDAVNQLGYMYTKVI